MANQPDEESDSPGKVTGRLDENELEGIHLSMSLPFGMRFGTAQLYIELPTSLARSGGGQELPRWRIELHGLAPGAEPLGLDVLGDVVLGRGSSGPKAPDLDLSLYDALERGVSRRHALLRPTSNYLFIIDLGSTNGTQVNSIPLGPGVARPITNNAEITLGRLTFTVKIIDSPAMRMSEEKRRQTIQENLISSPSDTKPLGQKRPSTDKPDQ